MEVCKRFDFYLRSTWSLLVQRHGDCVFLLLPKNC